MKSKKYHTRVAVAANTSVHAFITKPVENDLRSLFIFSHGFSVSGTESFGLFVTFSRILASQGYSSILFDYRGSGYSDLNFEEMTFDTELADLHAVINFANKEFSDFRINLWGLSMGCAIAAQAASERSDISTLILWSLSAELYRRYKERFGPEIEENGFIYIDKGFKVSRDFLKSLQNRDTYRAIKEANIPTLLIHGDEDPGAPIELARNAHRMAPTTTTLQEIKGGNHGFKLQPELLKEATNSTLSWINKHS